MTKAWSQDSWTPSRRALATAVYRAAKANARYAPMLEPVGSGNLLLRHTSRERLNLPATLPATIPLVQVITDALMVFDATVERNRFTGPLPGVDGVSSARPPRGELYCSEDVRAAIAELLHYADGNLARKLVGEPERLDVFTGRAFLSLRAVNELNVVSLQSDSPAALPFFATLEKDPAVKAALIASGYADLFTAIYGLAPNDKADVDYSAARGLGRGLESNPGIDGLRVISARDYDTRAGGQDVKRTGDNLLIFGLDQRVATHAVRIEALHLVDKAPASTELTITHYRPRGGMLHQTGIASFTP
jgi:hypothetical protein